VAVPFTFGVPFPLTLADDITFEGRALNPGPVSAIDDLTSVYVTLHVFDDSGNPVSGASIAEVPELSSLTLLITVVGLGLLRISGRRILSKPSTHF
jgi:hypothetical protein